jgi:hypothetical protein
MSRTRKYNGRLWSQARLLSPDRITVRRFKSCGSHCGFGDGRGKPRANVFMSAASLSAARRRLRRNLLPRFETAVRPAAAFCMISLGSIVQRLSGLPTVLDYASSTNERALGHESPSCSRAKVDRDGIADRAVQHHRRRTRRSSSAPHLTSCSRSRTTCPETDWVGKSRRGPGPFDSTG